MKKALSNFKKVALALSLVLLVAGCKHANNLDDPDLPETDASRVLDFRLVKQSASKAARFSRDGEEIPIINETDTPTYVHGAGSYSKDDVADLKLFKFETDTEGVKVTVKPTELMKDNGIYGIYVRWIDNNGQWNIGQHLNDDIIKSFNKYEKSEYTWVYPITNAGFNYRFVACIGYENPDSQDGYNVMLEYEITAGGGVGCSSDMPVGFDGTGYVELNYDELKLIDVIPVQLDKVKTLVRRGAVYEQAQLEEFSWDDSHWVCDGEVVGKSENDLLTLNFNDAETFQYSSWGGDIITTAPYIAVDFYYSYTLDGYDFCTFHTPNIQSNNDENTYFSQPVASRFDITRIYPLDSDMEIKVIKDDDGVKIYTPQFKSKYNSMQLANNKDTGHHDFYSEDQGYVYPFVLPKTTYRFTGLLRDKNGTVVARTNSVELTTEHGHGTAITTADYDVYEPVMKVYPTVAKINNKDGVTLKASDLEGTLTAGDFKDNNARIGYRLEVHQSNDEKSKDYWDYWMGDYISDDPSNIPMLTNNTWDSTDRLDYYNLTLSIGEYCVLKDGTPRFERTSGNYKEYKKWIANPIIGTQKTVTVEGVSYKVTFGFGGKCVIELDNGTKKDGTWTRTGKDVPTISSEYLTFKYDSTQFSIYYDYSTDKFTMNPLLDTLEVDSNYQLVAEQDPDGVKLTIAGDLIDWGNPAPGYTHYQIFNDIDTAFVDQSGNTVVYANVRPAEEYNFTAVLIDQNGNKKKTNTVAIKPENGHGRFVFEKVTERINASFAGTPNETQANVNLSGEVKGTLKKGNITKKDTRIGYRVCIGFTNDKNNTNYYGGAGVARLYNVIVDKASNISIVDELKAYKNYQYMNMIVDLGIIYAKADGSGDEFLMLLDNPWGGDPVFNIVNPLYDAVDDDFKLSIEQDPDGLYIRLTNKDGETTNISATNKYTHFNLINDVDNCKVDEYGTFDGVYPCVEPGKTYNFTAVLLGDTAEAKTATVTVTPQHGHGRINFDKVTEGIKAEFTNDTTLKLNHSLTGTKTNVSDMEIGYEIYTTLTNDINSTSYWGSAENHRVGTITTATSNIPLSYGYLGTNYSSYQYLNLIVDLGVVYTDTNGDPNFLKVVDNPGVPYNVWIPNPLYGQTINDPGSSSSDSQTIDISTLNGTWKSESIGGMYYYKYVFINNTFDLKIILESDNSIDTNLKGNFELQNNQFVCSSIQELNIKDKSWGDYEETEMNFDYVYQNGTLSIDFSDSEGNNIDFTKVN